MPIADVTIEDGEIDTRYDYAEEILIDGKPIEGFDSMISDYTVPVESLNQIPSLEVKSNGAVTITQAEKGNMVATVKVVSSYNPDNVMMYSVTFKMFTHHGLPAAGSELKPANIEVSAEPQPENGKANLYDNCLLYTSRCV